ncbi:DUF5125 domain-containing protein [Pedobacter sp. UBA4863]|uniref:DUF5125 domain-containing protein n=1 Tax=Pedobacter sp. UBA4863 TaxID=1947060 RepID=UPI0025D69EBC|nr:DUF5125 domain-containing protein [Pedobacter sp. UBA4863]
MKRIIYSCISLGIILFAACKKEEQSYAYFKGNPVLTLKSSVTSAHFGDSLAFNVQVSDTEIPLSTVKVQLFYTDDKVQEVTIRTKENGEYSGKIYVPFYKNVPDGAATIKFVLQNISKKTTEQSFDINLSRPDYEYLSLITETGTLRMDKVGRNEYAITANLPYQVKGYIEAPKVGAQGNVLNFGWQNNTVEFGSTSPIPFSNSSSGVYTIRFNTLNYEASPFIVAYAVNGTVMNRVDDSNYRADINLTKDAEVVFDGIQDLTSWWIDSDFFTKTGGKLFFNALSGKYRITANFTNKYFIVEAMDGNNLATLKGDGTGAIWIIGTDIGKPSLAANEVGWNTDKALCLAPIGNKKYRITVVGGQTIKRDAINFKFFHQKGWGGEFTNAALSTTSDIVFVGSGGASGRDPGNLGLIAGKTFEEGRTYVFVVDLSLGNTQAVLTVTPQ